MGSIMGTEVGLEYLRQAGLAADSGKPTRNMFDSEEEYRNALYEYYQTSEGKKEMAREKKNTTLS